MRTVLFCVIILSAMLLSAATASCQSPTCILYFDDVVAAPGADLSVNCLLDSQGNEISAWSIGICYSTSILEIIGAEAGFAPQSANNGNVVDYMNLEIWPNEGVLQEVIISTSPPFNTLEPGPDHQLARIDFSYVGPIGATAAVEYCSSVPSINPTGISIENSAGSTIPTSFEIGLFPVTPGFIRGDVNGDSSVDIADVIILLGFLFNGLNPPGCIDACDGSDDGLVNLADAIVFLGYLFAQGSSQLPPPGLDCGADPTDDPLDCLNAGGC